MAKYGLSDVYFGTDNLSELLQTQVIRYDLMQTPQSSTNTSRIAMSHRSSTSRYFTGKLITVQMVTETAQSDITELEAIISRIRMTSQTRWKDLKIVAGILENDGGDWEYASESLTWRDTRIQDFDINMSGRTAVVTIAFISDDPIGYVDTPQTLFTATGVTSDNQTFDLSTIDLQGTFYLQKPKYTITVDTVTVGSTPSFTVTNGFAALTYDGLIESGDVFIIDTEKIQVTRNGNLVDFNGALPVIDLDTTTELSVTHTYTALDYDILIDNKSGYI